MSNTKPKAYFNKLLVIDCETSGLCRGSDNPAVNNMTGERYQSVSWGIIVADADTLLPIDELYLEIKWDHTSSWDMGAQKIHKLSKEHLDEHGVTTTEAVEQIASLMLDYFGPTTYINIAGNNPWFDLCFLRELLRSEGLEINFSNRLIDTNSVGFAAFSTYSSDELFEIVSPNQRTGQHNALEDATHALKALRLTRQLFTEIQ
jgi:oligoribonuclease (3'-5' exoribonuclease)